MSFNIRQGRGLDRTNRWYKRRDLVFEVIRKEVPHVLGAQEVHQTQLDEILGAVEGYAAVAHRRYGGLIGAYAPIFFAEQRLEAAQSGDFWLAPDPDGRRKRAWDAAVPRICTWAVFRDRASGKRFAVFNSHFDQRGVEARLRSARLLAERLGGMAHLPRLVTLDLNANEQSEPLRLLSEAGMRDTFRVVHPDAAPAFTYHRFRGTRSRGVLGKIDYVLCDAHWTVHDAAIVRDEFEGRLPSDHYPVTADLALKT
jgi:endonuclease/exonuclease/phosphatase family metal-dependent hydrolase